MRSNFRIGIVFKVFHGFILLLGNILPCTVIVVSITINSMGQDYTPICLLGQVVAVLDMYVCLCTGLYMYRKLL